MKVVIIGTGNVATILGRLMKKSSFEIVQVIGRNLQHAALLGEEFGCAYTDTYSKAADADLYLIAIADTALTGLYEHFHVGNKLVVHTAGSVSKNILRNISIRYGVLYPLQSLRKETSYIPDIPLLVDGNTAETIEQIKNIALQLSPLVDIADDEQRQKLHIGAVVVNNFTNHLFTLAEQYFNEEELDFKILLPLINETVHRLKNYSPSQVQTGPAARNDVQTLEKHLRLLADHPKLRYIYLKLTDSIMDKS